MFPVGMFYGIYIHIQSYTYMFRIIGSDIQTNVHNSSVSKIVPFQEVKHAQVFCWNQNDQKNLGKKTTLQPPARAAPVILRIFLSSKKTTALCAHAQPFGETSQSILFSYIQHWGIIPHPRNTWDVVDGCRNGEIIQHLTGMQLVIFTDSPWNRWWKGTTNRLSRFLRHHLSYLYIFMYVIRLITIHYGWRQTRYDFVEKTVSQVLVYTNQTFNFDGW